MQTMIELEQEYGAMHYAPLPVVLSKGEGVYVWDTDGKRYLDMMSAYSAVSHGHAHPRLLQALHEQAAKLAVVSRAYYTDQLGPFSKALCEITEFEKVLPMNTGAEAVETAIKAARKWAYDVKGVAKDKANIIACQGNFHGRTLSIISMSSEAGYQQGFGPLTPGFKCVPYGDVAALAAAIDENTAAFIVEPIQGEGGLIMPPSGYLKACADLCRKHNALLICDEVQTGMGRTGKFLACQHENVKPDGLIMGKALGGGLLPVSAFLADKPLMDVFTPGTHGSTFGGNPLACHVASTALDVLFDEELITRSKELGDYMLAELQAIQSPIVKEVRGKGLFIGLEIDKHKAAARDICLKLLDKGLLSKETHETVVRFAPPLLINKAQIDEGIGMIREVLTSF